jgi:chromosome segregation ATPase
LSETSKYDLFLDELNALEKQIYYFIQKGTEILEANQALSNRMALLERENENLKKKITDLELKASKSFLKEDGLAAGITLNPEEKETLKNKINDLIARIDYHLRS